MNILDLHELRDGVFSSSKRLTRSFNPFIHVDQDAPLIRALYAITRPAFQREQKIATHSHTPHRTKLIHATGGKAVDTPIAPFPKGSAAPEKPETKH